MKILAIALLIIIALVFFSWKRVKRGVYRTLSFIPIGICELLDRGFDGGFMIFNHANSEKFIQLSKWGKGGSCGLELSFPLVGWSKCYEVQLREYCQVHGLLARSTLGSDGTEFIDINFSKNVAAAAECVEYIFLSIFGIPKSDGYFVRLEGASA